MALRPCINRLMLSQITSSQVCAIETDSTQLKDAITWTSRDLSIGGSHFVLFCFVLDMRSLLHENLNCLSICNILRSCNPSGHELPSIGMSWDPGKLCIWADPLPGFFKTLKYNIILPKLLLTKCKLFYYYKYDCKQAIKVHFY
jgi:hypothetical protein